MKTELVYSNRNVEQNINQVAIVRGPIVYCLEELDIEEDVNLDDIYIPRDFSPENFFKNDLLGGITILQGKALKYTGESYDNELYNRSSVFKTEFTNITMIPYFAWHNRGNHKMSVWFPVT